MSAELNSSDAPGDLLTLYDEALPIIYGYFLRRCGDRGVAEDLTAQTFLTAMAAATEDHPPTVDGPWLLRTARRGLAEHYRRHAGGVETSEPGPVDGPDDWDDELNGVIAEMVLTRLPEPQRVVLMLRYMDDRPLAECAELLGRTLPATEALLLEARRTFRALYPSGEVS